MEPRGRDSNCSTEGALSDDQIYTLTYIYLGVLPFSLLGSGSVIAVSIAKGRCLKSQVRPLFILSLSDFLAGAFLITSATIQVLPLWQYVSSYYFCIYGVLLALMFFAVSFAMVIVYAYEVHQAVKSLRNARAPDVQEEDPPDKEMRLYLLYGMAWLIPLLLFLAQMITMNSSITDIVPVDNFDTTRINQSGEGYSLFSSSCILLISSSKGLCYQSLENKHVNLGMKIIFFVYLLVVMSCCTVLYCRVNLETLINERTPLLSVEGDGFNSTRIRSASRAARLFQLTFVLYWSPAFLLGIFSFTNINPSSLYFLFILQALTVSLHGLLNSFAYGWSRQNFRLEATRNRMLLNSILQRAFYEESLNISQQ